MARSLRQKSAQLLLRLTEDLKERLLAAAVASDRTLTSEVNERLEASFHQSTAACVEAVDAQVLLKLVREEAIDSGNFRILLAEEMTAFNSVMQECRQETTEMRRELVEVRRELADIRRSQEVN